MSGLSAIYRGAVRHRRHEPVHHEFSYGLGLLALDLDDLPEILDPVALVSARRAAPWRFARGDYHGDPELDLRDCVRDSIEDATGIRPSGPIQLLTQIRAFGFSFNPVSFYFAHEDGEPVAMMAEITNTPWLERHHYVLGPEHRDARGGFEARFAKTFHVSPFMPMNQEYHWRAGRPGEALAVHMRNLQDGREVFDVSMTLRREPFTAKSLRGVLLRQPLMGLRVAFAIYWQALRLKLKGTPFFDHPETDIETKEELSRS